MEWVYSKDQALAQSKVFLKGLNVQTVAYPNTAMAAQYVASQNDVRKAAIGSQGKCRSLWIKDPGRKYRRKYFEYDSFYCDWIRTTDTRESF